MKNMNKWKKILSISLFLCVLFLSATLIQIQWKGKQCDSINLVLKKAAGLSRLFSETRANNYTTSAQSYPDVARLTDDKFVIVWSSEVQDSDGSMGVYATIFDNTGQNLTREFRVNTYIPNAQNLPCVSRLTESTFVVIWQSSLQDSNGYEVYGKIFDDSGTNLTDEFRVNTYIISNQMMPSVSRLNDTRFVCAWESYGPDTATFDIYAKVFDNTGNTVVGDFRVNTNTTGSQQYSWVRSLNENSFVVVWRSNGQDGDGYGIFAKIFNSLGTNLTDDIQVNTNFTGDQTNPKAIGLTDNKFVVVWDSDGQDGSGTGIYGKLFDNTGINLTNEFQVNAYTDSDQYKPSVNKITDNTFAVAWESVGQDPFSSSGVYSTILNDNGINLTNEFRVNEYYNNPQGLQRSSRLNETDYAITWISDWQDTDQKGVYFTVFRFSDAPPESNTPSNNSFKANSTGNTIDWILTDDIGTGNYTVLKNGSTHIIWDDWENNTNLQVPIDTNSGLGIWNYTIEFNDSYGNKNSDTVWITIYDEPPESNHPSDMNVAQSSISMIPWILTDDVGPGYYRVIVNNSPSFWYSWGNNSVINFGINTSISGVFNYTMQYNDSNGLLGIPDEVIVEVYNDPPQSNHPSDIEVDQNTEINITWTLIDDIGSGHYRIILNETGYVWKTWTNNTEIDIEVITTTIGSFNYTIQFNDSNGLLNYDVVMVTVNEVETTTTTPIPGFEFIFLIFGFISLLGLYLIEKKLRWNF